MIRKRTKERKKKERKTIKRKTKRKKEEPKKEEPKKEEKKTEPKPKPAAQTTGGGSQSVEELAKKQTFKKFSYRGEDIIKLSKMNIDQLAQLFRARQRRRLKRKLDGRYGRFLKRVMGSIQNCTPGEKPKAVKTHLRDCIVLPQMVQGMVSIHSGNKYNSIEIKPEMIGFYLGEFAMTYKKVSLVNQELVLQQKMNVLIVF